MTIQRPALLLAMVAGFLLCSAHALAQNTVFKLATVAPEGSSWMEAMRAGGKEIDARTDGRVSFKFYGGGIMGNDKKVLRKMRIGQLHGGAFVSSGLAERAPDIQLYGLPLLFNDQAEITFVRDQMDETIFDSLAQQGLVCLGIASGGFAHVMSAAPVRVANDLKGQKVWVPEGDLISYATMSELGLSPVTLPITDVLTGLQTGLIDIIGSSPVGALVLQWHTKVKYMSDLPVSYLYGILVIEDKAFERLSADDQAVVREVFAKVYGGFEADNLVDDKKALKALLDSGIELVEPDASLVPQWRESAAAVRNRLAAEGVYSAATLRRIEALLAEYRTSGANAAAASQ